MTQKTRAQSRTHHRGSRTARITLENTTDGADSQSQEQENTTEIHVGFPKIEPRVCRTRETHKANRKKNLNRPEIKNLLLIPCQRSAHGNHEHANFSLQKTVYLNNGMNNIALLSVMVGLPDAGVHLEQKSAGLNGVTILDKQDTKNLSNYSWGYQVGLLGEKLQIYTEEGTSKVQWSRFGSSHQPLKWYKTVFDAPGGNDPVALNLGSMGKGEAWVNGQSIGRYWVSFHTPAGAPSQTWYNVPRSFLKPTGNLLVLLDEEYGTLLTFP
ncbi:hypothetical protein F0562_028028 [Nyssa sinensis]|uniref:beta-galactosidase n=1 Tax=Nyssa sinensis TaxID=561372 RepID=A0A5J5B7X3_9ASTE|nr:hypothetical protein F0562_028028 [Nyssa sinensis]